MITEKDLEDLGFSLEQEPYSVDPKWKTKLAGTELEIYFDFQKQSAKFIGGEFCIIERKCFSVSGLVNFISCIIFLYNV